jgi:hypothetical protein
MAGNLSLMSHSQNPVSFGEASCFQNYDPAGSLDLEKSLILKKSL